VALNKNMPNNILQNGEKSTNSIIAAFSPMTVEGKDQKKVETQQVNSSELLLNKDYTLPQTMLQNNKLLVLKENSKAKKIYEKTLYDAQNINYEQRKINSFDGIGIDFGSPLLDVVDMIVSLSERVDENGIALIDDHGRTFELLVSIAPDISEYKKTGKISDVLASSANKLKNAFYTELKTAKDKYYFSDPESAGNTILMDSMEKMLADLSGLSEIALKGPEESVEYMQQKLVSASNSVYNYVKADDILTSSKTSKNAKTRLINNPWYLGYVEAIKDSSPDLVDSLSASAEVPYITDIEEKTIRAIMQNASEVNRQKQILEDEFGWKKMNEIFSAPQSNGASFNDLLQMQWDLKKTALDDEIEDSIGSLGKLSIGYDSYLESNVPITSSGNTSATGSTLPATSALSEKKTNYQFKNENYEQDKKKTKMLGLEITREQYENALAGQYSDIKKNNLNRLLYDQLPESNQQ